jgi:hypothetical protein
MLFFFSTGTWTQDPSFPCRKRAAPIPFPMCYFLNRELLWRPSWPGPQSSYLHFLCIWDDRHTPPCPAFYWLRCSLPDFLLKPQSSWPLPSKELGLWARATMLDQNVLYLYRSAGDMDVYMCNYSSKIGTLLLYLS